MSSGFLKSGVNTGKHVSALTWQELHNERKTTKDNETLKLVSGEICRRFHLAYEGQLRQ